jgi:hypothetical protein
LIINDDNVAAFTKAGGRVEVTSANLAGKDSLVIEGISVTSTSGNSGIKDYVQPEGGIRARRSCHRLSRSRPGSLSQ